MNAEQQSLHDFLCAIRDMDKMPSAVWRNKYPFMVTVVDTTHILENASMDPTNRITARLRHELQLRIAAVLAYTSLGI